MINPYKIKEFPVIILVDNRRSFISWAIKAHSKGNYQHVMILYMHDLCASQDATYKTVHIDKYLKKHVMLKFWVYTGKEKEKILDSIRRDLITSRLERRYDFLGILGQLLRLKWINNPKTYYCSERVAKHMRDAGMILPKHPSPSKLNQLFKEIPEMKCLGHWFAD